MCRFRAPFVALGVGLLAALAATGCGARQVGCESSTACPDGTVCQPTGQCAPLAGQARLTRARWLPAAVWATTRADRPSAAVPPTDVLLLGGDLGAVTYLGFGPLPRSAPVARAELVLQPHESWSGPASDTRLLAHRTRPFRGSGLRHRSAPESLGGSISERRVAQGGPRPVVLDLTDTVRQIQRGGGVRLYVRLRLDDGSALPWRLSSPRAAEPHLRPRLELGMR